MSQQSDQPSRQPPRFVPTLTEMVRTPAPALVPSPELSQANPNPGVGMPAAFAELLKDWPTLGEPFPAESVPQQVVVPAQEAEQMAEPLTGGAAEQIAARAEALVMQRLPAALAGLVGQAVRDALHEHERDARRQSPKI